MLIQLVLSLLLLGALVMTWKRARQQALRRVEALLWSGVWLGSAIVIWQPDATTRIAHLFGIGRGADFILYGAVIVLLLMVFQLHIAHDRLERALTELVRQAALREFERDHPAPSNDPVKVE